MDAAGEHPDRATSDAAPARRAPWGTRGRLAVAAAALGVAVAVAAVALRSVGVDLGGPVSVAAGATAEGGDDLHRIEPVAVAQSSTTVTDPGATDAPLTDPGAVSGPGGLASPSAAATASGVPGATQPGGTGPGGSGGSGTTTTLAGGLLPGVTVPPPSDVTSPVISLLPPPLDTTVSTLLQPVDPLLQPLDPILGGLLGSGTTTTTQPR